MENYTNLLANQLKEVEQLRMKAEKRLRKNHVIPSGSLRVSKSNGVIQYFIRDNGSNESKYRYTRDRSAAQAIAQHDYDTKIYEKLTELCNWMSKFLKHYDIEAVQGSYEGLSEGRRRIVEPVLEPDDVFAENWINGFDMSASESFKENRVYLTDSGHEVRSKSEKIIDDLLTAYKIPHVYEPRVVLEDERVIYPDFAVLNVSKRKTYYWEHFGLVGDVEYSVKNFAKICEYEYCGIGVDNNLIISFESAEHPLSTRRLREKIEHYFL